MASEHVASNMQELQERFPRARIIAMVRERHPKAELAVRSPFAFFMATYEEVYGRASCEISRARLMREYIGLCGNGELPDYYVRCLLPNYRGSA